MLSAYTLHLVLDTKRVRQLALSNINWCGLILPHREHLSRLSTHPGKFEFGAFHQPWRGISIICFNFLYLLHPDWTMKNRRNFVRNKIEKVVTQHKNLTNFCPCRIKRIVMSIRLDLDLVSQIMYLREGDINPGDEEKVDRYEKKIAEWQRDVVEKNTSLIATKYLQNGVFGHALSVDII
jgi:hypothetical protein